MEVRSTLIFLILGLTGCGQQEPHVVNGENVEKPNKIEAVPSSMYKDSIVLGTDVCTTLIKDILDVGRVSAAVSMTNIDTLNIVFGADTSICDDLILGDIFVNHRLYDFNFDNFQSKLYEYPFTSQRSLNVFVVDHKKTDSGQTIKLYFLSGAFITVKLTDEGLVLRDRDLIVGYL